MENISNSSKGKKSAVVIGAGISGLDVAWKLAKEGFKVVLLEKQNFAGGLASSLSFKGYTIDIGPHYLSLPNYSNRIEEIKELMNSEIIKINVGVKVYFFGHIVEQYPSLYDVMFRFGFKFFLKSITGFLISKIKNSSKKQFSSAEDYCISTYGKFLYDVWFRSYLFRRYGDPRDCSPDIAMNTFSSPSLKKILSFLVKKPSSLSSTTTSSNSSFDCYFKNGYGTFPEKICQEIEKYGGKVILSADIQSIDHKDAKKSVKFTKNGEEFEINSDVIFYATPPFATLRWFNQIPDKIKSEVGKMLAFHSIMVILFIDSPQLYNWWIIDVYDPNLSFFRISQQSILSESVSPSDKTLLCVEIRCSENDPLWKLDDNSLAKRVIDDLKKARILRKENIDGYKIMKLRNVYPVINPSSKQNYVVDFINSFKNEFTAGTLVASPDTLVSSRRKDVKKEENPRYVGVTAILMNTENLVKRIIDNSS